MKSELQSIKNSNDEKELQKQNEDLLRFKLNQLFKQYERGEREFSLPKFEKLSFWGNERNDFYNSMFYSKICFNYLDRGRIEDFSQLKVKADDSEDQKKQKLKAQKIQKLILSMNEEYCLAFMLYQLLYTDGELWDNNINFYDTHIKKIMDENKKHQDYLFNKAKNILLRTNIKHRITKEFLDILWNTRNDKITTITWFDQFGNRHRMTKFKILYIQWLLTERSSLPRNRFEDFKNNEFNNEICVDYFILTDKVTGLFTKDCNNSYKNDLQHMIEYILSEEDINLRYISGKLSLIGLLKLEHILKNKSNPSFNNRVIFDSMGEIKWLFNNSSDILDFYILKLIDDYYLNLYQDKEFINGFKSKLDRQLNSNMTTKEYVDVVSEKIHDFEIVSTSGKREIVSKLNDILNT